MNVRSVNKKDVPEILNLYKQIFNKVFTSEIYDYFFYNNVKNHYTSIIAVDDGKIIGHNGIIIREYKLNNKNLNVGLSSGGMVLPEYSGVFYQILKKCLTNYEEDVTIAFPNKNSEQFFLRLFGFNSIVNNYFTLFKENFVNNNNCKVNINYLRSSEFIEQRIKLHPFHNYKKIETCNNTVYYKIYNDNEIDLIFSTSFSDGFAEAIERLLHIAPKINLVHWDKSFIESLGFTENNNNKFVYKNNKYKNNRIFECQMIDSDVF